jgi:hypothetical protein
VLDVGRDPTTGLRGDLEERVRPARLLARRLTRHQLAEHP